MSLPLQNSLQYYRNSINLANQLNFKLASEFLTLSQNILDYVVARHALINEREKSANGTSSFRDYVPQAKNVSETCRCNSKGSCLTP